ncbi:MAG: HEPN domain-containing protein [bacterium]
MSAALKEWLQKAEEDYGVALREVRVRKNPANNAVCFHAQQCLEKYMKAVLVQKGKPFTKTHDLNVLLSDCLDCYPLWAAMRDDLKRLSQYAVQFRYPGESADRIEAVLAVKIMKRCRLEIRSTLGLHDAVGK